MNTVFIGYDPERIARDVCEYSLRHTTEEIESKLLKKINELRDKGVHTRSDDALGSTESHLQDF